MHPAYSVIFFTTMSGAGYGLLALLGILGAAGVLPPERWFGLAGFAVALGLITSGLLSSTFHLGHPERAWRAISQWRSSWLSREGVASLVTYVPAGLFAIGWVFLETIWPIFGWLSAVCAIATIYTTSMIYASLRTMRHWNNPWVPPAYLSLGFATGAVLLNLLVHLFGLFAPWATGLAITGLAIALLVKLAYWRSVSAGTPKYTVEQATGLGHLGKVRQLEPPHSRPNFVMREMGYEVARNHADKLRMYSIVLGFVVPIALIALTLISGATIGALLAFLAVLSAAIGVAVERWLFFAEAEHVVTVYYGAEAA